MKNCVTHTISKFVFPSFLLFAAFLSIGCAEEQKQEPFIARVNEARLTEQDVLSLTDSLFFTRSQISEFARNWVISEVLYQSAVREGITELPEFKQIMLRSEREAASSFYVSRYFKKQEEKIDSSLLIDFYDKNKELFRTQSTSYLLNMIVFKNENTAFSFRRAASEFGWDEALRQYNGNAGIADHSEGKIFTEFDLPSSSVARVIPLLQPGEMSYIMSGEDSYFYIALFLERFEAGGIPPFSAVVSSVKTYFVSKIRTQMYEDLLKQIYSQNDIEIKIE